MKKNKDIFKPVLEGKRHKNYDRSVKLAKLYFTIITGEGMDEMLTEVVGIETPELFVQRKRITKHITKTVANNLISPQYKVPRANNIQRVIRYDNQVQTNKLNGFINNFYGGKSVDAFMNEEYLRLNNLDPNSFMIINWSNDVTPYPVIYSAEEVLDISYDRHVLDYVICKGQTKYTGKTVDHWIGFFTNGSMTVEKWDKDIHKGKLITKIGDLEYYITETSHGLNYIPGKIMGQKKDDVTRGILKISQIDNAMPIFEKMIKPNSELDLTMALLCFPKEISFGIPCNNKDCNKGYLPSGDVCPDCKGTGLQSATSAQHTIKVAIPNRGNSDIPDLHNFIVQITPSIDTPKFQHEYIKDLTAQSYEAVYNSQIYSRKEIAETATGKNIELQNIYDSLYPLAADGYAPTWEFIVKTIADIYSMTEGLTVMYKFSRDFKMKGITEILTDIKLVHDGGADSFVKRECEKDLARIFYADKPDAYNKFLTMEEFFPFNGKTEAEIQYLLTVDFIPKEQKILYANYGWIFDDLSRKDDKYYFYTSEKKYQILMDKVKEIISKLPKTPTITDINGTGQNNK